MRFEWAGIVRRKSMAERGQQNWEVKAFPDRTRLGI